MLMNQFSLSAVSGTRIFGTTLECEFYDASPSATLTAGEFVCLSSTVAPLVTKVAKGTGLTSKYFGVVLTNPLKVAYAVGEKIQVAIMGSVVLCQASGVITCGDYLQYDYSTAKVATQTASNSIVGVALENSAADAALLRVLVFQSSIAGATGAKGATGATGPTGPTGPTAQ